MKVIIVYGFLGAGKTTLIRHLLATMVEPGQVAVLVNDFGRVNVDGATLTGQHLKVMPLASGCICCTLAGAFIPAVEELQARWGPEWLVIEPTGVAAPNALERLIQEPRLARFATLEHVVTVIDASRFLDYQPKLGEFYTAQVEQANLVLLNKADLAEPAQLAATAAAIRELNPRARVNITQQSQVAWADLLAEGPALALAAGHVPAPDFDTCEAPLPRTTRLALEHFFESVRAGQFGHVYRAKGIAQLGDERMLINYTDGRLSLEPAGAALTDLVIVGRGLDAAGLVSAAQGLGQDD